MARIGTRRVAVSLVALSLGALVAGCGADDADATTRVTGTDDACELASTDLPAGTIGFEFANEGSTVSELYVLRENDDIVGEVENVGPGTARTLTVDLAAGEYRARCKPGQQGDGITAAFTVSGEGGTEQAAPDRTIRFDAVDFDYRDLDLDGIATGDTIRFEMANTADQPHEFEVLDPAGDAVGEVAAVAPGETGGATITFAEAGTYRYRCILVDEASGEQHDALGMAGEFEVAAS
ncbi:MAG: cupredoxin domain-containing protein [Acidimicrobiales bacterium]